ncbi:hypothetical protein VXN63_04975 [Marinilactibacillus sp. XAAS-LB27]|uniref:hypothetical protein n=1 Tax=Marinilactibacillus sp. XAAS-LB27 TaxID=3114538 RepID=UPI002E1904E7|nr:hypothetical protein [Marinilactibacillus sp. XAAS-LB27]
MQGKYHLSFEDMYLSERLASKFINEKKRVKKINSFVMASFLIAACYLFAPDLRQSKYIISLLLIWLLMYLYMYFFGYYLQLKNTIKLHRNKKEIISASVIVQKDVLKLNYPKVSYSVYWSSITDIKQDKKNFYILFGNSVTYFIVKKEFLNLSSEETEYIVDILEDRGQKRNGDTI